MIFNYESVKNYIMSLSTKDFDAIIKSLNKNDISFLQCETFTEKLKSMSVSNFYSILNSMGSQYQSIMKIVDSSNYNEYISFLNYVSENFVTEEINKIKSCIISNEELDTQFLLNTFKNVLYE